MPEQQKKHEFPIIPFMLLGVLIINSAVLAYKYINFYYFKDILADIHSLACTTDCDAVMLSKYALLFGIPTPIFGLASFSLLCYMFSRIHFGTQHPDLKTKINNENADNNDRSVLKVDEDHEDDENAEIGVSLHALESELEKIQRVFETFLILLVLIALSYMYIMFFTLELVCKFCMLSHITLFLFAAYYFIYYKRLSP
ncbi:MAG: vitamin K epoxide reductase family protein [Vampirovibrionia bacterium]